MRKYYLFLVQSEYFKLYRRNSMVLYRTLENLYHLSSPNLSYGISLFQHICSPFGVKLLHNYIQNRFKHQKEGKIITLNSSKEKTKIQINYACIIVVSNINFPDILKVFNIYHKKIFVCDFLNEDYFWLNEQIQKRK